MMVKKLPAHCSLWHTMNSSSRKLPHTDKNPPPDPKHQNQTHSFIFLQSSKPMLTSHILHIPPTQSSRTKWFHGKKNTSKKMLWNFKVWRMLYCEKTTEWHTWEAIVAHAAPAIPYPITVQRKMSPARLTALAMANDFKGPTESCIPRLPITLLSLLGTFALQFLIAKSPQTTGEKINVTRTAPELPQQKKEITSQHRSICASSDSRMRKTLKLPRIHPHSNSGCKHTVIGVYLALWETKPTRTAGHANALICSKTPKHTLWLNIYLVPLSPTKNLPCRQDLLLTMSILRNKYRETQVDQYLKSCSQLRTVYTYTKSQSTQCFYVIKPEHMFLLQESYWHSQLQQNLTTSSACII